jgi:predicted DNA-binding ribbon-helix-helix protein
MSIYIESGDVFSYIFNACSTEQISAFVPQKRGFRLHGHSTTIRLETAFWDVLEEMALNQGMDLPELITTIHDHCMVANDKNLASCLRVICMKYINICA